MIYYVFILFTCLFLSACNKNKHHTVKEFYEDGKLKSETQYIGRYANGTGKMYYPDGNLWQLRTFKDGKPHGKAFVYHKNGKVQVTQIYKNGQLNGKSFRFLEDGMKIEETNWVNGHSSFSYAFSLNGDTIGFRRGNKLITYHHTKKIAAIMCLKGYDTLVARIKFSEDGKVLNREGILTCLTKNDTLRLNAQYPDWKKY